MTPETEQKIALFSNRIAEAAGLRAALARPKTLRREAERLLSLVPHDCHDMLTWSSEGYTVGVVASVLADEIGREVRVHRASMVTPLAPATRSGTWSWICAEQLLGFGEARAWAVTWAAERGGLPYTPSGLRLVAAAELS